MVKKERMVKILFSDIVEYIEIIETVIHDLTLVELEKDKINIFLQVM